MASREDVELCRTGDSHACYRVIRDESDRIKNKIKESEKESGVSSGDGYYNSSNREGRDSTNHGSKNHKSSCPMLNSRKSNVSNKLTSGVYCPGCKGSTTGYSTSKRF